MAIKKQTKSRKKIRRKLKRQGEALSEKLLEKIKRNALASGREIRVAPPDQAKMSEVFIDFVSPLLKKLGPEAPRDKIFGVAMLAWNLSLLPEEEHKSELENIALELSLSPEGIEEMNELFTYLLHRKKEHFSEHRRNIVDFLLTDLGDTYNLQVVSVD